VRVPARSSVPFDWALLADLGIPFGGGGGDSEGEGEGEGGSEGDDNGEGDGGDEDGAPASGTALPLARWAPCYPPAWSASGTADASRVAEGRRLSLAPGAFGAGVGAFVGLDQVQRQLGEFAQFLLHGRRRRLWFQLLPWCRCSHRHRRMLRQ
jgi:hypothetical protein